MIDSGEALGEGHPSDDSGTTLSLIFMVHARLYALPLVHVIETMRPLPVEAVAGSPPFVRGLAVIRGTPVPVVDMACLLGAQEAPAGRFVSIITGGRLVALAVDSVSGVRAVPTRSLHQLPPLLQAAGGDVVSAIGLLDAELVLVLDGARWLPDEVQAGFTVSGAA